MKTLGYGQTPSEGGMTSGHKYVFMTRGDGILTDDLYIAVSLLCRGFRWDNKQHKVTAEYKAGTLNELAYGREKRTGGPIFMFHIIGNVEELNKRRLLIHAGAHLVDSADAKSNRKLCLDRLADARYAHKEYERLENEKGKV